MAAVIALLAVAHPGVMACGDARNTALVLSPVQHRAKFHLPIAARARQWRDAIAVALHQEIHDLLFEVLAEIHHVVLHTELFADPRRIHQALGAAGALAAHQPEREPFHLPARFH